MVLSDEMSLKFQFLFNLKCFKSFTGPIYFDTLLGERSGTVPMYLPEQRPHCSPASLLGVTGTRHVQPCQTAEQGEHSSSTP